MAYSYGVVKLILLLFQNKALRTIVNASWYVRNDDLHRDIQIDKVKTVIQYAKSHSERLHINHISSKKLQTYTQE